MREKRISFGQGKGSLTHNNRTFIAKNVDESRIPDNVVFIAQPIAEAYEQLFSKSQERYNARQKRNDRKIHGTYYESLFHQEPSNTVVTAVDKRKSFYEDVVQIGKMEDSGIGTEDAQLVAECLKEYMNGFQARNPNFYVFNAILHMDEATPHLHIDYIPVAHHKRGMDTQNGIAKALEEMGYGTGKMAIARWRAAEVEVLNKICREHSIEPLPPDKSRGTIECEEYREQMRKADEIAQRNAQSEEKFAEEQAVRQDAIEYLDSEMNEKAEKLAKVQKELDDAEKKQVKLCEIDSIETKKSVFGNKITLAAEDFDYIVALVKKQATAETKEKKYKAKADRLEKEVTAANAQIKQLTAELAELKKPATFSREKLKQSNQRISETENLRSQVRKYQAFIDACGLSEDFKKYTRNKSRNTEIE